jgi:hypothetical protein
MKEEMRMNFLKFNQNQKNGHRGGYLFLVVLILTLLGIQPLSISALGEEKKEEPSPSAPGIPTLNYSTSNGKIVQDFLPYYKSFRIVGSTKLPDIDADWVRLEIWKIGKKAFKKAKKRQNANKSLNEIFEEQFEGGSIDPIVTRNWKRGLGDNTSTFELIVPPLTGWKKRYFFTFTFYDKPDKDSKFIKKIVDSIIKELQKKLESSGQVTGTDVKNLLNSVVQSEITGLTANSDFHSLNTNQINPRKNRSIDVFKFDDHPLVGTIQRMAVDKVVLKNAEKNLMDFSNQVSNINDNDFGKLINELNVCLDKAIKDGVVEKLPFNRDDIELLKDLKKKPEMVPRHFDEKFIDINTPQWAFRKISDTKNILQQLIDAFTQVYIVNEIRNNFNENMDKIIADLKKVLAGFYVKHSTVFAECKVPFTSDETELDRLRIGTIYGLGGAILNASNGDKLDFEEAQLDLFSYVGIKYYLGPVDRRRPRPFLTNMSRWSIHIGAVLKSEITYKGQDMTGMFGDMIPTFGIGFDLNPTFCLNLGVLLFKQPGINPLSEAKEKKWALFLGFSYDIDLFNTIKGLLSPSN